MSTRPNYHRGDTHHRQDNGPAEGRHAARGRAKYRRRLRRAERRRGLLDLATDALLGVIMILGLVGCAELPYDGPLWGDPCEMARTDPAVTLYACHWDGSGYQIGVCQEDAPGAAAGACRPFCSPSGSCAAGVATSGPLGLCYCAGEGES